MIREVVLTDFQAAYASMVLAEHETAVMHATTVRNQRMARLFKERGIPSGIDVSWSRSSDNAPMVLLYDDGAPDAPTVPADLPEEGVRNPPVREHEGA